MTLANGKRLARALLWILLLLPLLLALLQVQHADIANTRAVLNWLGRLTGIAGLTCLLLAAALIVRVPGFDRLFGGLTHLWRTHHLLGAAALLLLLAHPLLLAFSAAGVSLSAAAQTLVPARDGLATWFGWAALVAMMIFLAPSFAFFGEPDYQRWKWVHSISGVAVLLALAHTLLLARSLPAPWSWIVWGGLALLAVAAVTYRFVISHRVGRLPYRVSGMAHPANNVVELSLEAEEQPLKYRAGQFVYLTPYDRSLAAGYAEEHPYTLSSSPLESGLRIAIKDLGNASRAIQHISPGSLVKIEGPYGDFFPDQVGSELWIAGGIGITPFLGRARHIAASGAAADVRLIYCVQDEPRALFRDELQELARSIDGFALTLHFFYREGPLTGDFLRTHCADLADRSVYVCGPSALNTLAHHLLVGAGCRRDRIQTEEFVLL